MLGSLVAFSARRRGTMVLAWTVVLGIALAILPKLNIDATPDPTNVQVSVITTGDGLSPAEVERFLTTPVEMALNGLPNVNQIRSVSRSSVSFVTIVFDDAVNLWFARQQVFERLRTAEESIPAGYGVPKLAPVSTALGKIYEFYLASPSRSGMELRTLLDWEVVPQLRGVPGVIEVNAMGGSVKQYQVIARPERMAAYGVTLPKITSALTRNNVNVGSGYIEKDMESRTIRGEAQLTGMDDIGNVVIEATSDGTPIFIKEVADVTQGAALPFGSVTKHGQGEIVAGTVMMLLGSNSPNVVAGVKERLAQIQAGLPSDVEVKSYYDRAEFIERMLHTVFTNLAEAALLVTVVLFAALGSFRAAMLASLAIPLSMAVTVILMVLTDTGANIMSLGALDFGLLVDGAIVMLEVALVSLVRPKGERATQVGEAMGAQARPVAFSLAIIMLVYLPLLALQGSEGRTFKPLALTLFYALGGALLVSLTAIPALAAFFLPSQIEHHTSWADRLAQRYERLLRACKERFVLVTVLTTCLVLVSAGLTTRLGAEFVPKLEEGEMLLDVKRLPSISLSEAKALGERTEEVLAGFPEVLSVVTRTGRAEVATDPVGPDEAEVHVTLAPKETWKTADNLDTLGSLIKKAIEERVPATFVAVSQPIEDSINQLLAGAKGDVVISIFGDDLDVLKATADQIGETLRDIPGTGDLRVQRVLGLPLLTVQPDRKRLARYALDAQDVMQVVQASRMGQTVGTIFEGMRRFDLVVLSTLRDLSVGNFGSLLVGTPRGQLLPLASVADLIVNDGPAVIHRENMQRRVMVEVNVRARDLLSYVNEAQARVKQMQLPEDVVVRWGGQFDNFTRAKNRLALLAPVSIALIFCMLFFMFGRGSVATVVFSTVPLALSGAIYALYLRGLPFSIPAAVGLIAVSGVSVLNSVVMASSVLAEYARNTPDAAMVGASRSFRSTLTTALVAGIGFLPMAVSTHAGAEVQRPLATAVIGGILTATLLSWLMVPLLLDKLLARSPPQA